jgi:aminopeptidase N
MKSAAYDTFWYIRKKAVQAISVFKKKEHTSLFKEKSLDENSNVRVAALQALGKLQNPELIDFLKERFKKDDSYRAQAETLRSIGKMGDSTQDEFLQEAAKMKSPRNVLKEAAEWALLQSGN